MWEIKFNTSKHFVITILYCNDCGRSFHILKSTFLLPVLDINFEEKKHGEIECKFDCIKWCCVKQVSKSGDLI
jgi:hypothetical protein